MYLLRLNIIQTVFLCVSSILTLTSAYLGFVSFGSVTPVSMGTKDTVPMSCRLDLLGVEKWVAENLKD